MAENLTAANVLGLLEEDDDFFDPHEVLAIGSDEDFDSLDEEEVDPCLDKENEPPLDNENEPYEEMEALDSKYS